MPRITSYNVCYPKLLRDILEEQAFAQMTATTPRDDAGVPADPADADPLLTAMGFDPVSIDTLVQRSGLTADSLYAMLLDMELEGRVRITSYNVCYTKLLRGCGCGRRPRRRR